MEIEYRELIQAVVVCILERRADEIFCPRQQRVQSVAVSRAGRKAPDVEVALRERGGYVLRRYVVVLTGVDELLVGGVGYRRDAVDIARVFGEAAIYAYETWESGKRSSDSKYGPSKFRNFSRANNLIA